MYLMWHKWNSRATLCVLFHPNWAAAAPVCQAYGDELWILFVYSRVRRTKWLYVGIRFPWWNQLDIYYVTSSRGGIIAILSRLSDEDFATSFRWGIITSSHVCHVFQMRNNRDLPLSPLYTQHTRFCRYPWFSVHFAHVGYLTDWVWTWKLGQLQISYSFQYNWKYPTSVSSRRNLNIDFLLFRNGFYEEKMISDSTCYDHIQYKILWDYDPSAISFYQFHILTCWYIDISSSMHIFFLLKIKDSCSEVVPRSVMIGIERRRHMYNIFLFRPLL